MLGVLVHRIVALRPLPTSPQLQQLLVLLLAEGWDDVFGENEEHTFQNGYTNSFNDGDFGAQEDSAADEKVKGAADAEEQSAVACQHRISRSRGRGKKRRRRGGGGI